MKTKKHFKWPKEIYIFWLVDFILGVELIGPALLIFFKEWGGLNQTQTQILQSWFALCIFIFEIPTGILGDIKGKKHSVILGMIFSMLGVAIYTYTPNIYLFFLAELIFALGVAFVSGSKEAWMYDTAKNLKIEKRFREISIIKSNLHMLGMIVASVIFIPVSNILPVQDIFKVSILTKLISLILLATMIKSTERKREESLKPDYIGTARKGLKLIRANTNLKRLAIYLSILSSTSYFVIWLYQEALSQLEISTQLFGAYRVILLVAQIVSIQIIAKLLKRYRIKKMSGYISSLVAIGFFLASFLQNILGVILLLSLAGGIGLQVFNLFSKEINEEINSEQRATVLSFVNMVKLLFLTLFNPFVGYLVDLKGVFLTFAVLGFLSLFAGFFKPLHKFK